MPQQQQTITLCLTPMVRWMMSFGREVEEFPTVFNVALLPYLSERFKIADGRASTQAIALVRIDLLLLVALTLPSLENVEVFGTSLAKFWFFAEALLLASAMSFFFLVSSFITTRCYEAMVMAVCDQHVRDPRWNGRYLAAAHIDQHLSVHVTSQRLNFRVEAGERWTANEKMAVVNRLFSWSLIFALLPLLALHFGVTAWGIVELCKRANVGVALDGVISLFALIVNLTAIAIFISVNYVKQKFDAPVEAPVPVDVDPRGPP